MIKTVLALVILVGLGAGVYLFGGYSAFNTSNTAPSEATTTSDISTEQTPSIADPGSAIEPGNYEVVPSMSIIKWSGKKPLIEGYVDSGTIPIDAGTIEVFETLAAGMFILDMNKLSVGLTAKKPGEEGALETHLKSADFFDVAKYPTAEFRIKKLVPHEDFTTTFTYDLTGDVTMHGVTNEITFPTVLQKEGDHLVARAQFEIDRTLWDIKLGSGKYFSDLGENMIDDMIALDLQLVAQLVPATTSNSTPTATTTPE